MADQVIYEIKYSNGLFLTALLENSVNETSTSLVLYGHGATEYGKGLQQNFVKLLENFAYTQPPLNPLAGQFWYDTANGAMHYFSGTGWVPLIGTPNTDLSLLVDGQMPVVDNMGNIQYRTMAGDVSVDYVGAVTITKNSTFTLSGDVTGVATQVGKGNLTINTSLANEVVELDNMSPIVKEEAIHGTLRSVNNGRRFIMLNVPYDIMLIGLTLYTPIGSANVVLEYNNSSVNNDIMSTKTYTFIAAGLLSNDQFVDIPAVAWIAETQGLSIDFSGIMTTIDEITYTLKYQRV